MVWHFYHYSYRIVNVTYHRHPRAPVHGFPAPPATFLVDFESRKEAKKVYQQILKETLPCPIWFNKASDTLLLSNRMTSYLFAWSIEQYPSEMDGIVYVALSLDRIPGQEFDVPVAFEQGHMGRCTPMASATRHGCFHISKSCLSPLKMRANTVHQQANQYSFTKVRLDISTSHEKL